MLSTNTRDFQLLRPTGRLARVGFLPAWSASAGGRLRARDTYTRTSHPSLSNIAMVERVPAKVAAKAAAKRKQPDEATASGSMPILPPANREPGAAATVAAGGDGLVVVSEKKTKEAKGGSKYKGVYADKAVASKWYLSASTIERCTWATTIPSSRLPARTTRLTCA